MLLTLDPKPMSTKVSTEFETWLTDYNEGITSQTGSPVKHVNLTFEHLLEAIEDSVDERDAEIVAVLDDFRNYCFDTGLIPDGYKWMRAITVWRTIQDNLGSRIYYDQADRGYSAHGYIGLYSNKSIRAIGKLTRSIVASFEDGKVTFLADSGEKPTEEEQRRIMESIEQAKKHGYDLTRVPNRFFFVDKFYETDFRKASKYPIQRSKYFNLEEMLGCSELPPADQIAQRLNGCTWEEFA